MNANIEVIDAIQGKINFTSIGTTANVDLSDYYTKEEVNGLIPDTSGFALKTDIPDTTGFVSEDRVLELIEEHGGGNLPASEEGEF